MFLTRQDGSFRSKAFLGMKRLGILTQRDTLNLFLGMSASERNEWIGEVKERTKMETEPEIERGKENRSPWVQYIHYDKMLGFFFFFLQAPAIPLSKEMNNLFWYKKDKNFITIVSDPVTSANTISHLCQIHDSQGVRCKGWQSDCAEGWDILDAKDSHKWSETFRRTMKCETVPNVAL